MSDLQTRVLALADEWKRLSGSEVSPAQRTLSEAADDLRHAVLGDHRVPPSGPEVGTRFIEWAMKNEIAEPPLDWAWFGEIARWSGSPIHEANVNTEATP